MRKQSSCSLGSRPPNILWIVTTQWRAQALGSAGDPNLKNRTPCLDALARDPHTLNFAQAVTPHPFGPFARAAMLTGVPSPENGIRDYYDPLPPNTRTIAHELRDHHGYATSFFGKWHLSKRDPRAPLVGDAHARAIVPHESRGGFDFWEGFESGHLLNDPWLHGTRLPQPRQFHGYQSDILCARAAEYLRETTATAPQFCIVSLESPHPPYDAPTGRARSPSAPRKLNDTLNTPDAAGHGEAVPTPITPGALTLRPNVPLGGEIETRARRELAGYYAHIEATDAAIGRLIATVRTHAPARDTLIVFTSVHGDMHGSHGLFRKGWPHEESVRVPLLINAPFLKVETTQAPVSLLDLPAMMAAPSNPKSRIQNPKFQSISMPSVVRLSHQCDRVWRGVRTPSRKLILNEDGTPWLFFDLENDPFELRNLADDPRQKHEIETLRSISTH